MKHHLALVEPADIPTAGPTPTDNLIAVFRVCTQMERICFDLNGVGLSAVQVGVPWKVYIVLNKNRYEYFVDCEYEGIGEKESSLEGCLSLRNETGLRRFEVQRYASIRVRGKKLVVDDSGLKLVDIDETFKELAAIIHQHEADHHTGILISHIGKEVEML